MFVHNLLGEREAHAKAAGDALAADVRAPEAAERLGNVLLGNADAGILNSNEHVGLVLAHGDRDPAVLIGVAHGIAHEVDHSLADEVRVNVRVELSVLGLVNKAQVETLLVEELVL